MTDPQLLERGPDDRDHGEVVMTIFWICVAIACLVAIGPLIMLGIDDD